MWRNSQSVIAEGSATIYDDVREYQPMIDAAFQSVANEIATILNPPKKVVPLRA